MNAVKCLIYFILLGIITHFLGEALDRGRFDPERFPYRQFWWEKSGSVYKLLRVKRWKNKLPDAGDYWPDMQPKRIGTAITAEQLESLVIETCVSEYVHCVLCVLSLGACIIWQGRGGAVCCLISIFINLQFIIIQRYNRPHLLKLSKWLRVREERNKAA